MLPLIASFVLVPGPLGRLVGNWSSLETVVVDGQKRTLKLKGENRWIFKGKLLDIRERYTIKGDPNPGENHLLLRDAGEGKLIAWWHTPDANEPVVLRGTVDSNGMTLTEEKGRMRVVYVWDGEKAYDARLEVYSAADKTWRERTVARYRKR